MEPENALIQNLKDSGCSQKTIDDFLVYAAENQTEIQLGILSRHRRTLLDEIHAGQRKLYCLDYLFQEIKSSEKQEVKPTNTSRGGRI